MQISPWCKFNMPRVQVSCVQSASRTCFRYKFDILDTHSRGQLDQVRLRGNQMEVGGTLGMSNLHPGAYMTCMICVCIEKQSKRSSEGDGSRGSCE